MGPVPDFDAPVTGDISSMDPIERLKVAVGNITGQEMTVGKVVEFFKSGDHGYPQMTAAIEGAKSSVRLATYIFRPIRSACNLSMHWSPPIEEA